MKLEKLLMIAGVGSVLGWVPNTGLAGTPTAIQEFTPPQNQASPEYADFYSSSLVVNYSYNSTTGIGTFTAQSKTDPLNGGLAYHTGSDAAGTGGTYSTTGTLGETYFNGFYSLTAYIQKVGNNWEVVNNGSLVSKVDIYGNLLTSSTSDLLLQCNLATGNNTINAFVNNGGLDFDFLLGSVTGGESVIEKDFLGVANGAGGIILDAAQLITTPIPGGTPSLTSNWDNNDSGFADTFVPEPGMFSIATSAAALVSFGFLRRKTR